MPADMKETIAESAKKLIVEKRVKKLTVKDVVEECQITRQTFYYHFDDIPDLFRWMLKREEARLYQTTEALHDGEAVLKYFFQLAISAGPDVRRGMQTNYREEFQKLLYEYCYHFLESGVEQSGKYAGCSHADKDLVLRYHTHAMLGILQDWKDADTAHLDETIHKLYCLMTKAELPTD